jgi:hypothetical protein
MSFNPTMNDEEFLQLLEAEYTRFKQTYEASSHFQELRDLLEPEAWTIDRIFIMGLGNPPKLLYLAMILKLREWLEEKYGSAVEVRSYEQNTNRYHVIESFMRDKRVMAIVPSPIFRLSDEIKTTTLLFAFSPKPSVAKSISKNPELYFGVSMDRLAQECRDRAGAGSHHAIAADAFKTNHDSKPFPALPTGATYPNLGDCVILRRKEGQFKEGDERQGAWEVDW